MLSRNSPHFINHKVQCCVHNGPPLLRPELYDNKASPPLLDLQELSYIIFPPMLRSFKYQRTYLITFSMEQSTSWEANRFSASQGIPRILWKPKVHYRIHKCPPPVPILSQIYPVR